MFRMKRPLVTVKVLVALARNGGPIEIPDGALITPAAEDWLRGATRSVKRVAATRKSASPKATLYIVGDDKAPTVRTLLPLLERSQGKVRMLSCHGNIDGCMLAIEDMCLRLAECPRRRGVVLVGITGIAACVANKFPLVRAAVLSKPSSLFDAQRRLGANALIIDPGRFSLRQMQATIESFAVGSSESEPAVDEVIRRAEASTGGSQRACG